MQRTRLMLGLATAVMAALMLSATQAEEPKDGEKKKAKIVCPVTGKQINKGEINKEFSAEYKKGQVYFCCPNCPKAFAADTAKYATQANLQLVQTEQYVAKACPITGRELNPEQTVKVKGVEVTFCCPNCKGKVAELKGKKKIEAVFAEKPFTMAFEPKKKETPA